MCKVLKLNRSSYYYDATPRVINSELENAVIKEFYINKENYGTRKLKRQLSIKKNGHEALRVSRRKIAEIMKKYGLVSKYTLRRNKRKKQDVNNDLVPNQVMRHFVDRKPLEVVVSDLTYIKCAGKWYYLCILLDLHGRRIIGSAIGKQKDAKLVRKAFYGVQADLRRIKIFHSDRGSEFKNQVIDEIMEAFDISRSLSAKGSPIDNAVAESMYNIVKTEFVYGDDFVDLSELEIKWFDYVNWYNNVRIHGSLGYVSPSDFERTFVESQ